VAYGLHPRFLGKKSSKNFIPPAGGTWAANGFTLPAGLKNVFLF
jgi:hypothetical protein